MQTRAFKMHLNPDQHDAYRRRHDGIWPDLVDALREAGIEDYRIFLDAQTSTLFAVMHYHEDKPVDALPALAIMQKWWAYMADIMPSNADHSPISIPLIPVFALGSSANVNPDSSLVSSSNR